VAAPSSDLAGPDACGACHVAARSSWADSAHAQAFETLPEARRRDARCLGCHTDGTSGGVSCETCHGPASRHVPPGGGRRRERTMEVDRATCLRCHTPDAPRPFSWERDSARIAHGPDAP